MCRSLIRQAGQHRGDRPWQELTGVFTVLVSLVVYGCHSGSDPPALDGAGSDSRQEADPVQTAPDSQHASAPIENAVTLPEPSNETPFVAVASCEPTKVDVGSTFDFVIRGRTLSGWHIYAVDKPTGISVPTALELVLPPGVVVASDWEYPAAEAYASELGASFVYHGEMVFGRKLRLTDNVKERVQDIVCQLRFQACNAFSCLPPTTIELTATVEADSSETRGAEAD